MKIKFVNTSLHGVGGPFVKKAFEVFGFPPFIPVKEQQIPDPEFPTVRYPNPEEKGTPKYVQS
jgi:phosphomannomutase